MRCVQCNHSIVDSITSIPALCSRGVHCVVMAFVYKLPTLLYYEVYSVEAAVVIAILMFFMDIVLARVYALGVRCPS